MTISSKLIPLMAIILSQLFYSCSDEVTYSCDSTQNDWVKTHLNDIKSMDRIDWLNTDAPLSIPVYRAFSPVQKYDFWNQKMNEIQQLNWIPAELEHIELLAEYINKHPQLFHANISDDVIDDFDIFIYKWCNWAQEHLGWSNNIIYSLIGCGNKVLDTKGNIKPLPQSKGKSLLAGAEVCNCSTSASIYCLYDQTCAGEKNGVWCNTKDGCGHLFLYECNGECVPK